MTASKLFHVSAARLTFKQPVRIDGVRIFWFANFERRNRRVLYVYIYTIYKRALPLNGN